MKKNNIVVVDLSIKKFKNLKKYFTLFMLIFCSVVGVGFVSGAEIVEFFTRFGKYCYIGIVVLFFFVYFIIYKILYKCLEKNIKLRTNNFKEKIFEICIFFNVLIIASAMFSGLKYTIISLYNNNYYCIYIGIILVVFVMLLVGVKWLKKIDYFVITFTIMVAIYLVISLLNNNYYKCNFSKNFKLFFDVRNMSYKIIDWHNLILSIIFPSLYVFMNFFQVQPLVETAGEFVTNKKNCKTFALIFAFIFTCLILVFIIFLRFNKGLSDFSMPLLEYFKQNGEIIRSVFCFGLIFALTSTLVSCLVGVKHNLSKFLKYNNFILTLISFVISFILGFLPFNFYVSVMYPILGLINLIIFVFC